MHRGQREQYTNGWGVEGHNRGNQGEGWDLQERQGTIVGEGRGGGAGAKEYSLCPSMHTCPPASREQSIPSLHVPGHKLSAIQGGLAPRPMGSQACLPTGSAPLPRCTLESPSQHWEVHLHHSVHLPAPPALHKHPTAMERSGQPACPWEVPRCSGKPRLAMGSAPPQQCAPASPTHPREAPQCCGVTWPALPALRKCPTAPVHPGKPHPHSGSTPPPLRDLTSPAYLWEVPCCHRATGQTRPPLGSSPPPRSDLASPPGCGKCTTTSAHTRQPHLPSGSTPLPLRTQARPFWTQVVHLHCGVHWPALPTLDEAPPTLRHASASPDYPWDVPSCSGTTQPALHALRKCPTSVAPPGLCQTTVWLSQSHRKRKTQAR